MARLKRLQPSIAVIAPRLADPRPYHQRRDADFAWRAWYKTERWRKLRWRVLVESDFTCAICGAIVADTSRLVADHIEPHRGDEVLFFDRRNLQCLCKSCHDTEKQRQERRGVP